jgi:hypothetical protein
VFDRAADSDCVLETMAVVLREAEAVALAEPSASVLLGDELDFRDAVVLAQRVDEADEEDCAVLIAERLGDALTDAVADPDRVWSELAELDFEVSEEPVSLDDALDVMIDDSVELDVLDTVLLGPTEAIAEFVFISQFNVEDVVAEARIEDVGVALEESVSEYNDVFEGDLDALGDTDALVETDEVALTNGLLVALPVCEGEAESDLSDGVADTDGEPL